MAITQFDSMPIDDNGRSCAVGTDGFSTGFNADASWQAVTIPSGEECKAILIQCRPDDTEVYTHIDNPTEFHISFNSDGTYFIGTTGVSLSIAKKAGETVCYVRSTAGYKFAVMGLK